MKPRYDIFDTSGKDTVRSGRWDRIRYTFAQPAEGFEQVGFEEKTWASAGTLADVTAAMRAGSSRTVWLRLTRSYADVRQFNNLFFQIRHNGNFHIWINGAEHTDPHHMNDGPLEQTTNCYLAPVRDEVVGTNIYAVRFECPSDVEPALELATVADPWHVTLDVIPKQNAVLDRPLRDAFVLSAPDGFYYMTGTLGDDRFHFGNPCWRENDGIPLYKSADLRSWTYLGLVWTFDGSQAEWAQDFEAISDGTRKRAIFAPHINYIRGKYWLSYSVNHCTDRHVMGIGLAWADKPEGPYTDVSPDKPLVNCAFDPALFEDDDGTVYILGNGGWIYRLNAAMDGWTENCGQMTCANFWRTGFEGVFLFKHAGKYQMCCAEWNRHNDNMATYDCNIAVSDHLFGPYSRRYTAIRCGGHNNIFPGPGGQLYSTVWEYPGNESVKERPSICPLEIDEDGLLRPALTKGHQP
jgi:hypothetical protein